MYEPERVSTLTRSPMFTNSGTLTVAPVSSVAGLLPPPDAVSPRTPGSVCVTSSSTDAGELDVGRLVVDVEQVDGLVRLDPLQRLADAGLGDRELLVGLLVHEVRVGAVGVEELHLARLGADRAELLAGAERPVDHRAVGGAAQLRAHERAALAGLDVLELEDLEDGALDLDVVAVLELVGRNYCKSPLCRENAWTEALGAGTLVCAPLTCASLESASAPSPLNVSLAPFLNWLVLITRDQDRRSRRRPVAQGRGDGVDAAAGQLAVAELVDPDVVDVDRLSAPRAGLHVDRDDGSRSPASMKPSGVDANSSYQRQSSRVNQAITASAAPGRCRPMGGVQGAAAAGIGVQELQGFGQGFFLPARERPSERLGVAHRAPIPMLTGAVS